MFGPKNNNNKRHRLRNNEDETNEKAIVNSTPKQTRSNKRRRKLSSSHLNDDDAVVNRHEGGVVASSNAVDTSYYPKPFTTTTKQVQRQQQSSDKMKKHYNKVDNPLFYEQEKFLNTLSTVERNEFFSEESVSAERRAVIWMEQADIGERLINQYSWATPTARAIRILQHFAPIIEIGCGCNAYWCQQMLASSIDVVGYDTSPDHGGTIQTSPSADNKRSSANTNRTKFPVRKGGPEVLKGDKHKNRTLFLCYPDENESSHDDENDDEPISMAYQCLQYYTGEHIIHVGELYNDAAPSLSLDQSPWGRSSGPEFQQQLASTFHCILRIRLPNWLHTSDTMTVWRRSRQTTIVYEGSEDDDDSDEEVQFRYIPQEERLPMDVAAPCVQHLLRLDDDDDAVGTTTSVSIDVKIDNQSKERSNNNKDIMDTPATNYVKRGRDEVDNNEGGHQNLRQDKKSSSTSDNNSKSKKRKSKTCKVEKNGGSKSNENDTANRSGSKGETDYVCPW